MAVVNAVRQLKKTRDTFLNQPSSSSEYAVQSLEHPADAVQTAARKVIVTQLDRIGRAFASARNEKIVEQLHALISLLPNELEKNTLDPKSGYSSQDLMSAQEKIKTIVRKLGSDSSDIHVICASSSDPYLGVESIWVTLRAIFLPRKKIEDPWKVATVTRAESLAGATLHQANAK